MSLLKDAIDYAQRGHIFFKEPGLRGEVFRFLKDTLNDMAQRKTAKGAGTYLQPIINLLEGKKTFLITPDEELRGLAKQFFKENIDLILKLSALAKNGHERESLIYMIIKFLPDLGKNLQDIYRLMIKGYFVLIHTVYEAELYKEGNCLELAIRGLYRWDGEDLLNTWGKDQLVHEIKQRLTEKERKIYPEIVELVRKKDIEESDDMLSFLLFTTNLLNAIRLKLFNDYKKDRLYELFKEKINKITETVYSIGLELSFDDKFCSEIISFLEQRIGKEIKYIKDSQEELIMSPAILKEIQEFL